MLDSCMLKNVLVGSDIGLRVTQGLKSGPAVIATDAFHLLYLLPATFQAFKLNGGNKEDFCHNDCDTGTQHH